MRTKNLLLATTIAIGLICAPVSTAMASVTVGPVASVKEYKNCTALNKVYPHGVGKKGAKDKVRGATSPVKNFKVSTTIYKQNKKSDRDGDGVACEKR
jgi:uncharacterized membrane protein